MRFPLLFAFVVACHPTPAAQRTEASALPQPPPIDAGAPKKTFELVTNGDHPWTRAPDLLAGVPHAASDQIAIEGKFPQIYVYRRKDVPYGPYVDDAAVFARQANGTWKQAPNAVPETDGWPPHAFVGWNGGALLVDSQIENLGWAMSGTGGYDPKKPGSTFTLVANDATVSHPKLAIDPTFMAWDASSDGETLALLGTYGIANSDAIQGSRDVVLLRGKDKGAFEASTILSWHGPGSLRTRAREFGAAAIVWPPPVHDDGSPVKDAATTGGDEPGWKGKASKVFIVAGGKVEERTYRSATEQECSPVDAALVGKDVYVVVDCWMKREEPWWLVRLGPDGSRERVELPKLANDACQPRRLAVREADDLWIKADCNGTPAVFRRAR